jgi:regulator of protease activity HflC (stomatin/prohibitin superfamily)
MIFYSAIILIFLIIFIRKTFIIVPHQSAYIKERLGKYAGTLSSGFHFIVPIVEKITYRHTLKEEVLDVAPQVCITKDNVQVEVDGILYIQVLDPQKGSYGIDNYRFAAVQLAQTSMRSEMGKIDLDQTFVEREAINDAVVSSVDAASEPWGIKVKRYEIKNILPTKTVMNTMEQQMRAEREKRAEIYHSDGERTAMINRSEGEKRENINRSEGEKMKRINEAEGVAQEIELVAEATAEALKEIASAIKTAGGQDAVRLRIAQQYIRRFGEVVQKSHTSVVPLRLAMIQGFFEGVSKSMEGLRKGPEESTTTQKENA